MNTINESQKKFIAPVVFMTHGGPTQILETDSIRFVESKKFSEKYKGKIKAIICISAHYFDNDFCILSSDNPGTYHDHGFEEVFDFKWNAKGSKDIAKEIFKYLTDQGLKCSLESKRGFDHGCWSSLYPFGLDKDDFKIPVIQISLPDDEDIEKILLFGEALKYFRENKEYMIFGSGSITHNLRLIFKYFQGLKVDKSTIENINSFKDWFNDICVKFTGKERIEKMLCFPKHTYYKLSHPSNDHFLPIIPILVAAGVSNGNVMWEDENYGFKFSSYYFD